MHQQNGNADHGVPSIHCDLCDVEMIHKVAQALLHGLATACIDSTSGDIFGAYSTIATDVKKEMIEYLNHKCEVYIAESITAGSEASDPYDTILELMEEFSSTKKGFFNRISRWLLAEHREERTDDFVQEMETNGFWSLDRREAIAKNFIRNVDIKDDYHCCMRFSSEAGLFKHKEACGFRPVACGNDGCNARFSAKHIEEHDSLCLFKIIPCDQSCADKVMRREMDLHCITVCPMRFVNCPFIAVGCQSTIRYSMIQQHCLEELHSHLMCILGCLHKDLTAEGLIKRVELLEKDFLDHLEKVSREPRSLTNFVKSLDAKL